MVDKENFNNLTFDKAFRSALYKNPRQNLEKLGFVIEEGIELVIKTNNKSIVYVVMPYHSEMMSKYLSEIQAAGASAAVLATVGSVHQYGHRTIATLGYTPGQHVKK